MSQAFDRQSFLGGHSEQVLAGLAVAIVGYGGGGSHIGQQLAHLGIGRVIVVDPDAIELSNLNRVVGATQEDVRRSRLKVKIAERTLRAIRPEIVVNALAVEWQRALPILRTAHVVFGAVDSFAQRVALEAFARRFLIPYIDIGMDVRSSEAGYSIVGQVVLSMPGTPCLRCMGIIDDATLAAEERARQYGEAGSRPQVVWPNGVLASTAVGLLLQLVTPWHGGPAACAHLEYDGNRNTIREAPRLAYLLDRSLPCPHYNEEEVGDPFFVSPAASGQQTSH
jgi:molybdopterin/thiamine biosynthesis adenylyltransferase